MWLLRSKRGSRTCGHLHAAEAEAWRCLDRQAVPSAWSVALASLAPEDQRPKLGTVTGPPGAVLSAAALVAGLLRQSWEEFFVSALGLAVCVPFSFFAVQCFRREVGRPWILDWMIRSA